MRKRLVLALGSMLMATTACQNTVDMGGPSDDAGLAQGGSGGSSAEGGTAGISGGGSGGTSAGGGSGGRAGAAGQTAAGGAAGDAGSAGTAGTSATGGRGGAAGAAGSGGGGGSGGQAGSGGSGAAAGSATSCPGSATTKLDVLADGWPMPDALALDDTNVYFANWNHSGGKEPSIVAVPKTGAGSPTILGTATMYPAAKSAFAGPDALVLVGDTLYVRAGSGSEIWKMAKAGGEPQPVFTNNTDPVFLNTPPTGPSYGMAADATHVYFSRTYWTSLGSAYTSGVYSVPIGGGSVATIVEDQNTTSSSVGHAGTVLLESSTLTWAHWDALTPGYTGGIYTAGTDGTHVAKLVQTGQLQGIAMDGSHVYYAQGPFLQRVSKSGGTTAVVAQLPGALVYAYGVALDGSYAYVTFKDYGTAETCGGVIRIAKSDGSMTALSTGNRPVQIALDANAVYYTDLEAGTVNRVELP
jgi:hypothetical protein